MEENYILITKSDYQQLIESALKLRYVEEAVKGNISQYENFFDSSTVEKIKFILGKEKQSESV